MDRATLNFVFAGMNKIQDLSRCVSRRGCRRLFPTAPFLATYPVHSLVASRRCREVGQDLEQKLNDWETGATIIAHVFYEERMKIYSKLYKVRSGETAGDGNQRACFSDDGQVILPLPCLFHHLSASSPTRIAHEPFLSAS